jgi:hypothetical protein
MECPLRQMDAQRRLPRGYFRLQFELLRAAVGGPLTPRGAGVSSHLHHVVYMGPPEMRIVLLHT